VVQISFKNFLSDNPRLYEFSEPINAAEFINDTLFLELINTDAFKRLARVSFLGGIDYLLVPSPNGATGNSRYNRYQHSLGVARLALEYSAEIELRPDDRRFIVVAALLHDIGHAPLSHSVEPVFRECFGMDHHAATLDILFGHTPIGRDIYKILRRHSIDLDRLKLLISGKDPSYHAFFSGPINFDTIEGILRTRAFGNAPASFTPDVVAKAATSRTTEAHKKIVDRFWHHKNEVYNSVINSKLGVLADQVCQLFARRNLPSLEVSDFFITEDSLFRKLPGLRQLLTSSNFAAEAAQILPETIKYTSRRFAIDETADFFSWEDARRYYQTRETMILYNK
jgi:hypothetical protein